MVLRVSSLGARAGVSADTIRYYEHIGLLPEAERSPAGYRLYKEDTVGRLQFIKGAQRFGLRLDEIRELLDIRDRGTCPCGHTRSLLRKRVAEVDEELARLSALRAELSGMIEDWPVPGTAGGRGIWHCAGGLIEPTELFQARR